jgi:hypothetical protein
MVARSSEAATEFMDLTKWKALDQLEALDWVLKRDKQAGGPKERGAIWINDGSISPLDLYSYLKYRFGEPCSRHSENAPIGSQKVHHLVA